MERDTALPRLPRAGGLYLSTLLALVAAFYLVLVASLGLSAVLLVRLVAWTPGFVAREHTLGALRLLVILYVLLGVYAYATLRGLFTRAGGAPGGITLTRVRHPAVFALADEVAARVAADPIDEAYLLPGAEIGVWEETALYLPPGTGKRKIVLGMAALSSLTPDALRSVLAHEYAHFSHRDTFYARFIYRAAAGCDALLAALGEHGGWVRYINPLYWAFRLFAAVYPRLAARFSRIRELHADRAAAHAYGRDAFARALIATSLDSSFFAQAGADGVMRAAGRDATLPNVYHFVAAARREYERENPAGTAAVLSTMLAVPAGRLDTHPALRERLDARGVPEGDRRPPPPPRPVAVLSLDALVSDAAEAARGVPSAAEALFGADASALQARLTTLYSAPYAVVARVLRAAREGEGETPGAPRGRGLE